MIYLDSSAFIKLYFRETGSEAVHELVTSQDNPLPVWDLLEAELNNAFRLKVFWNELGEPEADKLAGLFQHRKQKGFYFTPELDRVALMDSFHQLVQHTPELGCRTNDILHVACARQLNPDTFATFDQRQRALAERAGLPVFPNLSP